MKITARWMTPRPNGDGSVRFYFQPRTADRAKGWPLVRLRDAQGIAIKSDAKAAAHACEPLAALYDAWLAGVEGSGPERIDPMGRVQDAPQRANAARQGITARQWPAGTIGAIVADYEASRYFQKLAGGTQADYRYTNGILVEAFGKHQWRDLSKSDMAEWLEAIMEATPHMGHQLYRQCRAVLGYSQLIYKKGAAGYIPQGDNPFAGLKLETPSSTLIVWPLAAVAAFVAHCDAEGAPSFGDAAFLVSWIGTRRADWMRWPVDFFAKDTIGFRPTKTRRSSNAAVVIPWRIVPELAVRLDAAKARLENRTVAATTFFYDDVSSRPWTEKRFGHRFRELRESFAAKHPAFRVNYMVEIVKDDPFLLPTLRLTARSWRHTCITLLLDKGATPDQIRSITGHSEQGIKTIEKNYRALTSDQAARALGHRIGTGTVTDIKEAKS